MSIPRTSPSFRPSSILPAAALILILAVPAMGGEETVVDGVPHVKNGTQPSGGTEVLELEEVWRAGGEDDEESVFGIINKVLVDDEGNIYLLDAQLAEIKVYSPAGELINTIGREGDGPGEFRGPTDMAFMPDGTIGVLQAFPGRVVKLNLDNTEAGVWNLGDPAKGAFYIMRGLRQNGGNVVAGGTEQHVDQANGIITRETFLSSLDAEGMRDKTYASNTVTVKLAELKLDEKTLIDGADRRFDMTPDGGVVVAITRNDYEISVFGSDGALDRVFTRDYESWKRDERSADIWKRIMETIQRQQAPGAPISWEETEPDIQFVRVAGDGRIWVLNSQAIWETPAGMFTYYDVFTPDGHFEKQVQIICEGDPQQDFLFFGGDEMAFVITGFWDSALSQFGGAGGDEEEAKPMEVIAYRIK